MRIVLNILTGLVAAFTLLVVTVLAYALATGAFDGEGGMAILAFLLYGAIGAGVTLVLGGIGFFVGRAAEPPKTGFPKIAILIGLVCLLGILSTQMF